MKRLQVLIFLLISIGCAGKRYNPNEFSIELKCPQMMEVMQKYNMLLRLHGPIPEEPVEVALYLDGNLLAVTKGFLVTREINVPTSISILYYLALRGRSVGGGILDYDEKSTGVPPIAGEDDDFSDPSITFKVVIRPAYIHPDTGQLMAADKILASTTRTTKLSCMSCTF